MSGYYGDWANRQEPVYDTQGQMAGVVAPNGPNWVAASLDGRQVSSWSTRRQAELEVLRVARALQVQQHHPAAPRRAAQAPQQPDVSLEQVAGAFVAGATFLGALGAFFGSQEQQSAKANDQADELRRQNDELRRQNDLLRQALSGMGPQGITKRR